MRSDRSIDVIQHRIHILQHIYIHTSYIFQTGFGWTNGVILDLLNTYGDSVELNDSSTDMPLHTKPLPMVLEAPKRLASAVYELIVSVVNPPTVHVAVDEAATTPLRRSVDDNEETIEIDSEAPEEPAPKMINEHRRKDEYRTKESVIRESDSDVQFDNGGCKHNHQLLKSNEESVDHALKNEL